jgi:DNA-binding transcriptional MocR family regulator
MAMNTATTLVDALTQRLKQALLDNTYPAGSKMPSVRHGAGQWAVSHFTVVQVYDRLIAQGFLMSRRGAGFFVQQKTTTPLSLPPSRDYANTVSKNMDVVWLLRNLFREVSTHAMPASGTVPAAWLDEPMMTQASRYVARQAAEHLLAYGTPQGWLPLREQLVQLLADLDIHAHAGQVMTTAGVTQGFTLVTRALSKPGDTVLVDAPAWFVLYATLAGFQRQIIGVPRGVDGPDLEALARLAALHKPKLYVTQSILHNPTSNSLSAAKAHAVLNIAQQHGFYVVEDDIYSGLHPGSHVQACSRLASLDQLNRVVYISGFSKTLAPNLRVGYIAAHDSLIPQLIDQKMMAALTTPEFGERVVHKILSDGQYRKHLERLRSKLAARRNGAIAGLQAAGVRFPELAPCGLFAWGDVGTDANAVANTLLAQGFVLAPGSLFDPAQAPSTRMRFNLATSSHPDMLRALSAALQPNA